MTTYHAMDVFLEVLRTVYPNNLSADIVLLHKVFYDLKKKFPEIMQGFKFEKSNNPYSSNLEEVLNWFSLMGVLDLVLALTSNGYYMIDKVALDDFSKNKELFEKFTDCSDLKRLCC